MCSCWRNQYIGDYREQLAGLLCTLAKDSHVIGLIEFRVVFVSSSSGDVGWDKCGGGCQKSRNAPGMVCAVEKKRRVNQGGDGRRENQGNRVMRRWKTSKIQKEEEEMRETRVRGVRRGEFCGTNGQASRWDEWRKRGARRMDCQCQA